MIKKLIGADKEIESVTDAACGMLSLLKEKVNTLLDIGCKDGKRTLQYCSALNINKENAMGVDVDEEFLNISKNHFQVKKVDIECDKLPYEEKYFDVVVINQVLEHIKNIHFVILEIDRILKVNGHLLIGIPNLAALHNRLLLIFGRQPLCMDLKGTHVRGFTHSIMKQLIKQNSRFKIIKMTGALIYPIPYPFSQIISKYVPSMSVHTFYLVKKTHENRV